MLSNTDHLAEAESAKAREQDALRDLAEARLEIERLRKVISVIQGVLSNYDLKLSEIPDTAPVDVPVKDLIAKAAEHWANVADGNEADTGPCELCRHFKGLCSGSEYWKILEKPCPIFKVTGFRNCEETPFEKWREAAGDRFHDRYKPGGLRAETEELREAACAMAKFLGDLLKRYE
mgnify:CR=1 FL=1